MEPSQVWRLPAHARLQLSCLGRCRWRHAHAYANGVPGAVTAVTHLAQRRLPERLRLSGTSFGGEALAIRPMRSSAMKAAC
jgi:hypothetical protein